MAKASLAAAALLLAAGAAQAEDSVPGEWIAPEVSEFSDWSVACDNARDCTAVSVSRAFVTRLASTDPGDYALPKLWVKRAAGPQAQIRVFVDTTVWGEAGAGEGPASLHVYTPCDGDCTGRAYRLLWLEPGRYELAPGDVAAFLAENTATSRAATRFADGQMHGIITTAGLTAALRYIDEVQDRRGSVTAIVAKGPKPARTVPPPPLRLHVQVLRGEEVAAHGAPAIETALRSATALHCPDAAVDGPDHARARFRFTNGQYLWALACWGNQQAPRRLWLIETPGQGIAPFLLPRPEQGRAPELPLLPNSDFDPGSGLITAYSGGKCGWRRRWGWTGRAFAMIDAVEMPSCYGIPLHQWLQTYRVVLD
jgi:hypothetical protein